MMDKTLGQIAHEAGEVAGRWQRKWATMGASQRADWEFIAAAVASAVKEEDAKICESERVEDLSEGDFAYNMAIKHCCGSIRASIKEGK